MKCFIIAAIGSAGSETRKHADFVLRFLLKPVLQDVLGFDLVRADLDDHGDLITEQIARRLWESDLCVADLTFLNPNVFYELGVRHAFRLPAIQIASSDTRLPFDTKDQNTIFFDRADADSIEQALLRLGRATRAVMRFDAVVSNPVSRALKHQASRQPSSDYFPSDVLMASEAQNRDELISGRTLALRRDMLMRISAAISACRPNLQGTKHPIAVTIPVDLIVEALDSLAFDLRAAQEAAAYISQHRWIHNVGDIRLAIEGMATSEL